MQHMSGYNVSLPWASCGNLWNNNLTCVDVGSTKAGQAHLGHFKGIVSRDKYIFLKGPKIKKKCLLNEQSTDGFTILGCLFVKNIQNKVSACFYKITYFCNCEFLPVTLFRGGLFRLSESRM
jgi:hypothetical protein